ncbi:hypothetical protein KXV74_007871, partial [Aspergillus fumigatus]
NKLSDIENTEAALKGKSLTGLKLRAAATTILHEMTHFYSLFGAGKTGDLTFTLTMKNGPQTIRAINGNARGLRYAVKTDCSGLQAGYFVCIGVAGSTTTTTSNPHSPQQTGIAANCNKYYFVEIGDGCAAIASTYSITLADFYSWNPGVGTSCQSLQAGYYVCVGVSGSTTSTSTTTTKPTTTTKAPITTTTASGPSPTQSGITADCETFDQAVSGDSCWTIVSEKYTYLTQDQFYAWNPAVGPTCSNLQAGYYYWVATKTVHAMPNTIST